MEKKLFLIQGLFFTRDYALSVKHDPEIGERVAMDQAVFRTMFSGVIKFIEESAKYEGALTDHYGSSILFDIELSEDKFIFKKRYEHRRDVILYQLEKDGDVWIGSYGGPAVGAGAVRCQLIPVDEDYFMPTGLERFLR